MDHAAHGRFPEALEAAQAAAACAPGDWRGPAHVGAVLVALLRPADALEHLQRAMELEPDHPEVLNNLGAALRSMGRTREAESYFERAIALNPGYSDAANNLAAIYDERGTAYWQSGRPDEGALWFARALDVAPERADTHARLGNALVDAGKISQARASFLRAIELAPDRADYYRFLAETDPAAITSEHQSILHALLARAPAIDSAADAHFALGKVFAAQGDPKQAFTHLAAANANARARAQYDEAPTLRALEEIAQVFSASMLAERRDTGHPSETPVFIFGMPRSGTTLVEQIIASHPHVYGAGELPAFGEIADAVLGNGGRVTAAGMMDADGRALRALGYRYVETVRGFAPFDAMRITDKMPANFQYAGLIHLALPKAKLIHVRRDPLDTCLSCFSHTFAGEGLGWSYDLGELGRYYRAYSRLMDHWRSVLPPGAMLEVQYEEIVDDVETHARRLLAYCGLPWDERCVRFHQAKRPVRTASAVQVRKPLYRSSIGKAREYGELLRPLIEALAPRV